MRMFDCVIIGGGPAGASCAIWLKMLGFRPVIVEQRPAIGGLQNDNPYPNQWIASVVDHTGYQVAGDMHRHVMEQEIACRLETEVTGLARGADGFAVTTDAGETLLAETCVLACGVRPVTGGLTASDKVMIGPGRTLFNAAFEGRSVAVLGGGDNAFENYIFVRKRGAREVHIHARSIRARRAFLERVPASDVRLGPYGVEPQVPAVSGRPYDLICALYGWAPHLPFAGPLPIARTARGFVETDADCQTSVPGLYAIGEIAQRMHPCCVTSMADGVVAAKAIQRALERDAVSRFVARVKAAQETT